MDKYIVDYLECNTILTLCVAENNEPYCANSFYVYFQENQSLIFKSKPTTEHIVLSMKNPKVAGTIIPNRISAVRVKGVQYKGWIHSLSEKYLHAADVYYRKYPFATPITGELWMIELSWIKMTDSKLGISKKRYWSKT